MLSSQGSESPEDDTEGNIYDNYNDDEEEEEGSDGPAQGHRSVSQATRSECDNEDEGSAGDDSGSNDSNFQLVSQEEIEKSMSLYNKERMSSAVVPPKYVSCCFNFLCYIWISLSICLFSSNCLLLLCYQHPSLIIIF